MTEARQIIADAANPKEGWVDMETECEVVLVRSGPAWVIESVSSPELHRQIEELFKD